VAYPWFPDLNLLLAGHSAPPSGLESRVTRKAYVFVRNIELIAIQLLDPASTAIYSGLSQSHIRKSLEMAKRRKRDVNVSAAIRDYLAANPDVGPKAAAEAISQQLGKKVSPTYVSNVKNLMSTKKPKKGRRGRKPGRPAGTARASHNGSLGMETIESVTKLVKDIGASTAKRLIDMLDWRK
jgi:hypothetical protein